MESWQRDHAVGVSHGAQWGLHSECLLWPICGCSMLQGDSGMQETAFFFLEIATCNTLDCSPFAYRRGTLQGE